MTKLVYVFDAYVRVELDIDSDDYKDGEQEARDLAESVTSDAGTEVVIFDAYGVEDATTGEELREVH